MKLNFIKILPIAAAMILAASCGSNDKDPVTPQPTTSKNTSEVTDNGDGTFTVPFTVKVSTGNSLAKKMEYSEGEDGKINIQFVVGTNDDEKLRVSGEGVTGELGLKGELDDMTMSTIYVFFGDLTLSNGVTIDDLEKGIDLYYEYGEALTEPASSGKSLLDLAKNCNHLYKGTAKSNEDEITLTDQNTYLAISMSPCCDHTITINTKEFTVKKSNNGRLWIAVPSGNEVKCDELGLSQSAKTVLPSVCHKVARQYFTVADGKKVYFSPGNLQFHCSNGSWRFAEQQSDVIGYGNSSISDTYEGYIDLFRWGTWLSGTGVTSPLMVLGDHEDKEYTWPNGSVSAIGLEWETLSYEEWNYLLTNGRDNASDLCHWGTINTIEGTIEGLIILPDGYNTTGIDWSEWATLESAGAVFLPAAGNMIIGNSGGTKPSIDGLNSDCFYWSSTDDPDSWAYYIYRNEYSSPFLYSNSRHMCYSVRLVRSL